MSIGQRTIVTGIDVQLWSMQYLSTICAIKSIKSHMESAFFVA